MKPILMNTEMVKAILDGCKTVTRRLIRAELLPPLYVVDSPSEIKIEGVFAHFIWSQFESAKGDYIIKLPYQPNDVLYVPEPWKCFAIWDVMGYEVEFQDGEYVSFEFTDPKRAQKWAKYLDKPAHQWQSPYFMPREAARIFLRITDVRVERLQDITDDDLTTDFGLCTGAIQAVGRDYLAKAGWNSTIKKSDLDKYGWDANPWVWVIGFERISKEEALKNDK